MKQHLLAVLVLMECCVAVLRADSQDFPLLGQLPQLGRDWSLRQQGAEKKDRFENSWVTFTNSKSGDIMSFAATKLHNEEDPNRITRIP